MNVRKKRGCRGAAILEFSMVGVGLIFVFLSFFELARGMWTYQTLAYAVREGTRYAKEHGKNCATGTASCQVTVAQIANAVLAAGPGLDPNTTSLTLTPAAGVPTTGTIANLLGNTATTWPPAGANAPGQSVKISATYPFRTFLAVFWPGGHAQNDSQTFTLGALSVEDIQF